MKRVSAGGSLLSLAAGQRAGGAGSPTDLGPGDENLRQAPRILAVWKRRSCAKPRAGASLPGAGRGGPGLLPQADDQHAGLYSVRRLRPRNAEVRHIPRTIGARRRADGGQDCP